VDLYAQRHIDVVGMVVKNVILDLVVVHKAKLAVRALTGFVAHAPIISNAPERHKGISAHPTD
jgi:hypothetical protein